MVAGLVSWAPAHGLDASVHERLGERPPADSDYASIRRDFANDIDDGRVFRDL